jgi:formate dehydrogenase subunit gamma
MGERPENIHKIVYERYALPSRLNHWVVAASLILLAIGGMSLFSPTLYPLSALFGGGEITRVIHPWIGVVLLVSFFGLFAKFVRHNFFDREDMRWIIHMGSVLGDHEDRLPEQGRYNAGQKIVFWSMSALIAVLFVSGLALWDTYFAPYTDVNLKRLAVVVHGAAAVIAIIVWVVHVYAAFWVKGTTRAMTRGWVSGGWGWKHHRKWLREEVDNKRG